MRLNKEQKKEKIKELTKKILELDKKRRNEEIAEWLDTSTSQELSEWIDELEEELSDLNEVID